MGVVGFLIPFKNPFMLLFVIGVLVVFWISYDAVNPSPEFTECQTDFLGFDVCVDKFTPSAYGTYLVWFATKLGFLLAVLFIIRLFGQRKNIN